uniref:Uncharacterized protein n=1 Tax=Chromera velia CCMP2878 TaxID=1169474 RepID=A0A0G4H2X7_9ALVE|eukprot:Cvel_24479.t1-p1 / transcript=Cvel_24479.t1 / gene=Cvel_24479 / organism=Chromera_velia_CCMP2878 / gene_product=hypothetical protein / transcript_product=hypothetical protein / location=Cvel_scaffold2650:15172-16947(+) / protein_length=239 / sequence_SO=supercontig / SO=protein_coding / is_pseudo=false
MSCLFLCLLHLQMNQAALRVPLSLTGALLSPRLSSLLGYLSPVYHCTHFTVCQPFFPGKTQLFQLVKIRSLAEKIGGESILRGRWLWGKGWWVRGRWDKGNNLTSFTQFEIVEEEVEKSTFPAIPVILEKWNILSFSIISRSNKGRRWIIGEIEFNQEYYRHPPSLLQMNVSDKRDPLPLFSLSWETIPKIRIHTRSFPLYYLFGKVKRAVANVEKGYGIATPEDKQLTQQLGGCVRTF